MIKTLESLTSDERSLLLYLETRAVDYGGKVDLAHMNVEDIETAERWSEENFIGFGRIAYKDIKKTDLNMIHRVTHWCSLSDNAWEIAHSERKVRNKRMWDKRNWMTTEEKRKSS